MKLDFTFSWFTHWFCESERTVYLWYPTVCKAFIQPPSLIDSRILKVLLHGFLVAVCYDALWSHSNSWSFECFSFFSNWSCWSLSEHCLSILAAHVFSSGKYNFLDNSLSQFHLFFPSLNFSFLFCSAYLIWTFLTGSLFLKSFLSIFHLVVFFISDIYVISANFKSHNF